jgi:hypothetical protein
MLKTTPNRSLIMTYPGHKMGIPLPNPGLYLYTTNSLLVFSSTAAVDRSASTRFARDPPTCYYGTDTTPQGPAYTTYQRFDQVGSSQGPHVPRTG